MKIYESLFKIREGKKKKKHTWKSQQADYQRCYD